MAARAERLDIRADDVLREIYRLATSDMRQVATWGPRGVAIRDSATLDDHSAAAVAEIYETVTGRKRKLKIKLHDKLGALRELVLHLGLRAPTKTALTDPSGTKEMGVLVMPTPVTAAEWAHAAQAQQAALAKLSTFTSDSESRPENA